MSLWEWIADRTILAPTNQPLDPGAASRIQLYADETPFELWQLEHNQPPLDGQLATSLVVLKFPGAGGRAERMGLAPIDTLGIHQATLYGVNPPGYGETGGRARVRYLAAMAQQCWNYVVTQHPEVPILITGNSLGCVSALYVASQFPASGLLLRNPPPLHQMIRQRWKYNAWNFGLGRRVANAVPQALDALQNARGSRCPALFVSSEHDRVVPFKYQQMIFQQYLGPKQLLRLSGVGHHDRIPANQSQDYLSQLRWLWQELQTCFLSGCAQ